MGGALVSRARRVLEDALERENVPEERRGEYLERFAVASLLDAVDDHAGCEGAARETHWAEGEGDG